MVISSDGDVVVEYVIQYQYKLRWEIIVEANLDHICCLAGPDHNCACLPCDIRTGNALTYQRCLQSIMTKLLWVGVEVC